MVQPRRFEAYGRRCRMDGSGNFSNNPTTAAIPGRPGLKDFTLRGRQTDEKRWRSFEVFICKPRHINQQPYRQRIGHYRGHAGDRRIDPAWVPGFRRIGEHHPGDCERRRRSSVVV